MPGTEQQHQQSKYNDKNNSYKNIGNNNTTTAIRKRATAVQQQALVKFSGLTKMFGEIW